MITISAFRWVPSFAQGLVRDLRVRWALEEAGIPYEVKLLNQGDQKTETYRQMQPFGQVPFYQEDDLVLFESGAILLHIAEKSEVLLPKDPRSVARIRSWIFAALSSIEPFMQNLSIIDLFCPGEEWAKLRRPAALESLAGRLQDLSNSLGDREYLECGRFTAADLLMTTVLRIPRHTDLVQKLPNLEAYRLRCEARPAFQRALSGQMKPFAEGRPRS